jgi:hypothetical protein
VSSYCQLVSAVGDVESAERKGGLAGLRDELGTEEEEWE